MPHTAAVPFYLYRKTDSVSGTSVTSTTEVVHGLLRLEADRLVVQWRLVRQTQRVGAMSVHTDAELEAVRDLVVPLSGVAGAELRRRWWLPWNAPQLVLRAADLRAFEEIAGENGLRLFHPAELILGLRRADRLVAEEFAAELSLAVAERALAEPGPGSSLPERDATGRLGAGSGAGQGEEG